MTRVAIYVRCSTADQSVALQVDGLKEYAELRRFQVVETYADEGVSGAKASRPALDRLLADAHRRRFDAVLVWKLDRLGRSLSHLLRLVEQLESLGVGLVSLGDPGMDTTSAHGRLIFSVIGAVAEFERGLIQERTRAGVAAARRRGRHPGRPSTLSAGDRARARRLRSAGVSHRAIARQLGCSHATVQRALGAVARNPRCTNGHATAATPQIAVPGVGQ
jgi:DNA invertase Pin-like site-specific DNA recombinase